MSANTLPAIIDAEIKRQNRTRREVAHAAKIHETNLYDYLNGKADIRTEALARLLDALGFTTTPSKPA